VNGYFGKLNLNINHTEVNVDATTLKFLEDYTAWQKYGVAYKRVADFTPTTNTSFRFNEDVENFIIGQLPVEVLTLERPEVWLLRAEPRHSTGRIMFPPHVDGVRQCSINIYYETHGERTAYYKYLPGGTISEVAHFIAEDEDVYLLNSSQPHSVEMVSGKPRESISISFITTPYAAVAEALKSYF
jgi:hypothetical protein